MKLPYSEVLDIVTQYQDMLEPGSSLRFNHNTDNCTGDSKSAKITQDSEGYKIKCFRCGAHGAHFTKAKATGRQTSVNSSVLPNRWYEVPSDATSEYLTWPKHALKYVNKYLSTSKIALSGIEYSATKDALVYPVRDIGHVLRNFNPNLPKVLSVSKHPQDMYLYHVGMSNTCIVVEDYLSWYKLSYSTEHSVLCLLGTHVKDSFFGIVNKYSRILIWLDNDNATVQSKQLEVAYQVALLGIRSTIIRTTKDPKDHTDTEIQEVCSEYYR